MYYLYETHTHSCEASACATWTAEESVRAHKEYGYTGFVLTNHFFYGNTCVDRSLPWQEWVRSFCSPYNKAKELGDKLDFQVFFGWEACYDATEFLIYGLDEQWLITHPEIKDATIEEQFTLVHQYNGIIIHPHPYRTACYIPEIRLFPEYIDGVEVYNANHQYKAGDHYGPEFDVKAEAYAAKYNFPKTAGCDTHHLPILGGGMCFDRKLVDINDFTRAVMNRECVKFTDGVNEYVNN